MRPGREPERVWNNALCVIAIDLSNETYFAICLMALGRGWAPIVFWGSNEPGAGHSSSLRIGPIALNLMDDWCVSRYDT